MKKQKKILVVGAFGYRDNQLDGQTIKTRDIYKLFTEKKLRVDYYDTSDARHGFLSLFGMIWKMIRCKILIIIPASKSLERFFPFSYYMSRVFRFEIIHICVGGWQMEFFNGSDNYRQHKHNEKLNKKIKVIMPQVKNVAEELMKELNFKNIETFPNFRFFDSNSIQTKEDTEELKIVFMARINKLKGYHTVFNLLDYSKDKGLDITVDFYGQIADDNKEDFLERLSEYKGVAEYKGFLKGDEIYSTLSQYDLLVLPTQYYTEGFPGSILDSYISGIPVVVTKWKHATEFVDDEKTGYIVSFENPQEEFNNRIELLYYDREKLSEMKKHAKIKAEDYSSESAWERLEKYL